MVETDDKIVFAKDISNLRKESSYKKFDTGYFNNVPDMGGYLYKFKVEDLNILLILDTTNSSYAKEYYKNKGWHFILYKTDSLKTFISHLADNLSDIIDRLNNILDEEQKNADDRAGGVPHGYQIDDNGEITVDPIEAPKVRKIYKLYSQYQSIRQVAAALKKPYSFIRDILDDYRYEDMDIPIIPDSVIKKTRTTRDMNRKNRVT